MVSLAGLLRRIQMFWQPISNILNQSYSEAGLPQSWKCANIVPNPKEKPARGINKYMRSITLTPIILKKDQNQYETIPNSNQPMATEEQRE